jgi:hypothetical protein
MPGDEASRTAALSVVAPCGVSVFDLRDDDFEHISDLLRRIDEARKRRDDRFRRESDQSLREQALSARKAAGKRGARWERRIPFALDEGEARRGRRIKAWLPFPGGSATGSHAPAPGTGRCRCRLHFTTFLGRLFSLKIARSDTQERSYCNSVDSGKGTDRCRVYLSKERL